MVANVETMAYAGATPWHGLGNVLSVEDTKDVQKVREKAGVIWNVKERAIFSPLDSGEMQMLNGFKSLARSDTGNVLSVVTNDYNVVQPEQVFEFYKHFADQHGFRMHTAGSLANGKRIWALAEVGKEFTLKGMDTVGAYLLLATSYDRSMATTAKFTSVRVVCQNTLNISLGQDSKNAIKVSHSAQFDKEEIILDVQALAQGFDRFHLESKALSERIVTREEVVKYFLDVLYPNIESVANMGTRQQNALNNVVNLFHNGRGQEMAGNTAWGLVNAVTLLIDHEKGRSRDTALNSAWFGVGEKVKEKAFVEAMKMVA